MSDQETRSKEQLSIGTAVKWRSQANGGVKEKVGIIVDVLPAGARPSRELFPSLHKHSGCGFGRDHVSYVVMVGKRIYWPRAAALEVDRRCQFADEYGRRCTREATHIGAHHV